MEVSQQLPWSLWRCHNNYPGRCRGVTTTILVAVEVSQQLPWSLWRCHNNYPGRCGGVTTTILVAVEVSQQLPWSLWRYHINYPGRCRGVTTTILVAVEVSQQLPWSLWRCHNNYPGRCGSVTTTILVAVEVSQQLSWSLWKCHNNYPGRCGSVSLFNGSGNLYSHILNTRPAYWVEEHGLINEAQAGFRGNYGTIDHFWGGTFLALVRRHSLTMVNYMLLLPSAQKAFDMVDSSCLWVILGKTGVRGKTFRAIQSMHDVVKSKSSCRWRLYRGFYVSWWFKAERSGQSEFSLASSSTSLLLKFYKTPSMKQRCRLN